MIIVELICLIFVVLIALSIAWSTLKTGISPMFSSSEASQTMVALIKSNDSGSVIDLGSGWGTLVIAAARRYPQQQVIGYELSWFPWLVSMLRKQSLRLNNLTLHRKDFKQADLNNASMVFCYLFPGGMVTLHQKLQQEQITDLLIVSNTFALPSCKAIETFRLKDRYQTPIYVYHWLSKSE